MPSILIDTFSSTDFTEDEKKCLQNLYQADYTTCQSDVTKNNPGTLQWVLQHENYRNWLYHDDGDDSQLLWISGNPGRGKTVLAKFLLESIEIYLTERGLNQKHHVLYFFDDKDIRRKSAMSLLKAFLHQLIILVPNLISHVMPHYLSQGDKLVQSWGTLWSIFCSATADRTSLDGVYLVVDALDECEESSRELLLKDSEQFFNLQSSTKNLDSTFLKVLATSRPYPNIETLLKPAFCIRLKTENNEEKHK